MPAKHPGESSAAGDRACKNRGRKTDWKAGERSLPKEAADADGVITMYSSVEEAVVASAPREGRIAGAGLAIGQGLGWYGDPSEDPGGKGCKVLITQALAYRLLARTPGAGKYLRRGQY